MKSPRHRRGDAKCIIYVLRIKRKAPVKDEGFYWLFIVCFLHQTTTWGPSVYFSVCCLSSVSYIKPQPSVATYFSHPVVYRLFPTSNHNSVESYSRSNRVVYRLFPTSNHNQCTFRVARQPVVYRLFPTSNHNNLSGHICARRLFIVCFLHQTTTTIPSNMLPFGCLSSVSYIKPQLKYDIAYLLAVVYRLFPTSNHNCRRYPSGNHPLFIVCFLHQTTTDGDAIFTAAPLFIVCFLHQTTTYQDTAFCFVSCLSSVSYIKPQP